MVGEDAQECDADNALGWLLLDERAAVAGQHSIFVKACSVSLVNMSTADVSAYCVCVHGSCNEGFSK
jgi:microcompartment protein CcmL/EutN